MITLNNNANLYLDLHVLQTVPPANLNRDDTGAPKTAIYGGELRARVSSQSWKRAMRDYLKEQGVPTLTRTLRLADAIMRQMDEVLKPGEDPLSRDEIVKVLYDVKIKGKDRLVNKDGETSALFAISPWQARSALRVLLDNRGEKVTTIKTDLWEALGAQNSIDLALFGRMVASDAKLGVDGAAQVAHALSVNAITPEYDFFTAIDDLKDAAGESGAAMLDDQDFNSSTLYRYANVNVRELASNLNVADVPAAVAAFVDAFVKSIPTGKQNAFAARTLPNYVLAVLRTDQPVSLVSAFEASIRNKDGAGYVSQAVTALEDECEKVRAFVDEPMLIDGINLTNADAKFAETKTIGDLQAKIKAKITSVLPTTTEEFGDGND